MKFGKLNKLEGVDFTLPPDHPDTAGWLQTVSGSDGHLSIYLGCTGWSMKEWVGSVYPAGTSPKHFLRAYGRQFNSIELNSTHYRVPTPETVDRWLSETPDDFRFCPKVPQAMSHSRDLGLQSEVFPRFIEAVSRMDKKLGCCFLQLPPHFGTGKASVLHSFLEAWPAELSLAVEFRHASWFSSEPEGALTTFNRMEAKGICTVITDVAGRRDVLHMRLTGPVVLIRFVGNDLHPTDYQRADDWVNRLIRWGEQGLQEAYLFPHQPDNRRAPEMAAYLLERFRKAGMPFVRGPELQAPGTQIRLFD